MNDQYRKNPRKLLTWLWRFFFVLWPSRWPLTIRSGGVWTRYAHLTLTPKHTFISRAEAFSISLVWLVLKHWFKSCLQSGDSHWAIRLWEKNLWASAAVLIFIISTFRPEFQTSIVFWFALTLQIHVRALAWSIGPFTTSHRLWAQHSFKGTHGRSYGRRLRWWSFRRKSRCLRHCSHTCSSNATSTSCARTHCHAGRTPWMIRQSNIQNVVLLIKSELAGIDRDVNHCSVEEDSSNFQLKIEDSSSATMQHAVEKAKTTANLEMTQHVRTLERSSEARFSSQQRELLSRPSNRGCIPSLLGTGRSAINCGPGSDNRGNKERRTH